MVCQLAALWVQLSVSMDSGWPHNALRHHWLMPISCHFRDCKALLVTSLTHVSGAISSVQTLPSKSLKVLEFCNLLMGTKKPQTNRPYTNSVIRTLCIDGWVVTFGTARRGLAGCGPAQSPLCCTNVTAHPLTASVPTSHYSTWH